PVCLEMFAGETSTNVANYYTAGIKGRWQEDRRRDDHKLADDGALVDCITDAGDGEPGIGQTEVTALTALNCDLRSQYVADCASGVKRWNRILEKAGLPHRLMPPHHGFNRQVGVFADVHVSP